MRHGGQSAPDMENVLMQIARVLARVAVTEDEVVATPGPGGDGAAAPRRPPPGTK